MVVGSKPTSTNFIGLYYRLIKLNIDFTYMDYVELNPYIYSLTL